MGESASRGWARAGVDAGSPPSNPAAPYDAVRTRRTSGLCAVFDFEAACGAKSGDPGPQDLLQNLRTVGNGAGTATSCDGFTTHYDIVAAVLGGTFGHSVNGTEVHCIQNTRTWCLGTTAIARDGDGTFVAFKCSNTATMWREKTRADAAVPDMSLRVEANGGSVFTLAHQAGQGPRRIEWRLGVYLLNEGCGGPRPVGNIFRGPYPGFAAKRGVRGLMPDSR